MLLRQMRYFVTVVEKNSFTEAAEACFISQSAISQQVQALEKELGVALLVRQGRRFSLTEAGEYFYRHSVALLNEAERIRRETARLGKSSGKALRIGYLRSWGGTQLQRALAAFSAERPEVSLTLMPGTHEEVYNALRENRVDLAFNDQRRAFSEQFVNEVLATAGTYVELSAKSPLSRREGVSFAELKDVPCVLIASRDQRAHEQAYYRTTLGFEGASLFADDLEAARTLVSSGRGFLPIEGVEGLPTTSEAIVRVPLLQGGRQIVRRYCAFWLKERALPECAAFADALREAFR